MNTKVLGISTSPRVQGNTDLLLQQALSGAETAGAEVEYLSLCDLNIADCQACDYCWEHGTCRIEDDFQQILPKLLAVDRLIFATPIFFMSVCGQGKLLIDRGQCLWARKYVLKQPVSPDAVPHRRAMVIAVGATRSTKMFDCVRLTMKYWLDALDMDYAVNLFVNQIDARRAILEHPSAMQQAARLGRELVAPADPTFPKPVEVELF
jgi:multimeric flavodoxin WrbA